MSDITIRNATEQERDAIRDLTLEAYQEFAPMMPDWAWAEYRKDIAETVTHPEPAEQIVAERDGEILGTVLLYPQGGSYHLPDGSEQHWEFPEVRLLAVSAAARGHGIGEALMRECLARTQRTGVPEMHLHTTDLMQAAMRMYERMGFLRALELDFYPVPEFIIKGYRYVFDTPSH